MSTIVMGVDPGLHLTGWGLVAADGQKLSYIAHGVIRTTLDNDLPQRLAAIHQGMVSLMTLYEPQAMAVEEIFVNKNAVSSLKLAMARGVILMTGANLGCPVFEYSSTQVKKTLVGNGRAEKSQVAHMVRFFLPKAGDVEKDAADALALAICHIHTHTMNQYIKERTKTA